VSARGRIPSLDGLRAISISVVLVSHLAGTKNFPIHGLPIGELGVRVFFVISGYLITTLLLQELERYGDISLRRFYLRRTFRIFPAYYVYLIAIVAAQAIGWLVLNPGDAAHAFTYTTNYHPDPERSWWMGHTWSLAVEEQFYLLWPAILVALGPRRGFLAAVGFVCLSPLIRVADFYGMPSWRGMTGESFWTVGDSIAIGCVLAVVRPKLGENKLWMWFLRSPIFALVPVGVVGCFLLGQRMTLPSLVILQTLEIAGVAACIDWSLRFPDGAVGKLLNWRPMIFIGGLSYSLYLWQQPFFNHHRSDLWFTAFPINLGFAIGAALLSYYLVEKPMLSVRETIETRLMATRTPLASRAEA
jgi:peptidoglycan/LPS O-acetylase OafA/YrhL